MKKTIQTILAQPLEKRDYNEKLFTTVAPRYDLITKVLSFGRDASWKRALIKELPSTAAPVCLDLACGTGDIAFSLVNRYPQGRVVGLDLTPSMIERAQAKNTHSNLSFVQGDMAALPCEDSSCDIVTGGYALRNAPDLAQALGEASRVLKPSGTAAFLDFSKPSSPLAQKMHYALLKFWGSLWGFVLHGDASVYGYIADSLKAFPDRAQFKTMLQDAGFRVINAPLFMGGMIQIIICEKKL
jgi:ubiquinone/menaquinone biosynthesis methyltransferase